MAGETNRESEMCALDKDFHTWVGLDHTQSRRVQRRTRVEMEA